MHLLSILQQGTTDEVVVPVTLSIRTWVVVIVTCAAFFVTHLWAWFKVLGRLKHVEDGQTELKQGLKDHITSSDAERSLQHKENQAEIRELNKAIRGLTSSVSHVYGLLRAKNGPPAHEDDGN